MSDSDFEIETVYRIWNNRTGDYIQVSSDADGLDGIDICYIDGSSGKRMPNYFTIPGNMAELVLEALSKKVKDNKGAIES